MNTTTFALNVADSFWPHFADGLMFAFIAISAVMLFVILYKDTSSKKLAQGFLKAREVSSMIRPGQRYEGTDHSVHYIATDRRRPFLVVTKHAEFLCDFDRLARFYAGERFFL
ncbi:hypothetical protein [Stenotrophomonas muris]|uniref:hypothetical protein n=1 Tax=Stenotrophomonas muris TaxID=2963283 RepID=UPI00300F56CB